MSASEGVRIMRASRASQAGAAMVEMALTISVFLMLVFGTIEFSLAYFTWARINDAAREATRYAIVNDALVDLETLSCPGGSLTATCTGAPGNASPAECAGLMAAVHRLAPFVTRAEISYACSDAGFPDRPMPIPEVTVAIPDVTYEFVVPSLLGVGTTITLPTARNTRTGEDLYTEGGGS